jgi:multidrug efflux pump subunit AcrA (membrane-fusion protein)
MRVLVQILLVVVILGAAAAGAMVLVRTKPPPQRLTAPLPPPLVEVLTAANRPPAAALHARGSLVAPRQPTASAQIAGLVAWLAEDLRPGAPVGEGQELLRLDPADRRLAVDRAKAEVTDAEARASVDRTLAIEARLASARATLAQAELDLARTVIRSPAAGWVVERPVDLGQQVSPGTVLVRLVTPELELVADLDEADLALLPDLPAPAVIDCDGERRDGTLVRLAPSREPRTRSLRAWFAVTGTSGGRWRAGAFASVTLDGRPLPPAVELPEHALLPGDRVWTVADGQLVGQAVRLVRHAPGRLWVAGLADGARIVITRLEVATEGMAVRVAAAAP